MRLSDMMASRKLIGLQRLPGGKGFWARALQVGLPSWGELRRSAEVEVKRCSESDPLAGNRKGPVVSRYKALHHTAESPRVMAEVVSTASRNFSGMRTMRLRYARFPLEYLKTVVRNGSLGLDMLVPVHTEQRI